MTSWGRWSTCNVPSKYTLAARAALFPKPARRNRMESAHAAASVMVCMAPIIVLSFSSLPEDVYRGNRHNRRQIIQIWLSLPAGWVAVPTRVNYSCPHADSIDSTRDRGRPERRSRKPAGRM